jgi:hypothetical protein
MVSASSRSIYFFVFIYIFLVYNNISNPRNSILIPMAVLLIWLSGGMSIDVKPAKRFIEAGSILFFSVAVHGLLVAAEPISYLEALRSYALGYFYAVVLVLCLVERRHLLLTTCESVLWVFVIGFFVQLIVYYFSGYYLDLRYYVSGAEAKLGDQEVLNALWGVPDGVTRVTSFFNEPGTFASIASQLIIISFLSRKRLSLLHILSVLALVLTFSTFGLLLAILICVFIALFYFKQFKRNPYMMSIYASAALVFFYLLFAFASTYVSGRFVDNQKNDGGWSFRQAWLDAWFDAGLTEKLFGLGIGLADKRYAIEGGVFIQDIGLWFHAMVSLGVFSLLFLWLIRVSSRKTSSFLGLLILLLSKNVFYGYGVLMTLGLCYCLLDRSSESCGRGI